MNVISNILMKGNLRKPSKNCDWDSILSQHQNDPDLSMNNLYNNTIYLLDEFAPYSKLTK